MISEYDENTEIFYFDDILKYVLDFCNIEITIELRLLNKKFNKFLPFKIFDLNPIKLWLFFRAGYDMSDIFYFDRQEMLKKIFRKFEYNFKYICCFYDIDIVPEEYRILQVYHPKFTYCADIYIKKIFCDKYTNIDHDGYKSYVLRYNKNLDYNIKYKYIKNTSFRKSIDDIRESINKNYPIFINNKYSYNVILSLYASCHYENYIGDEELTTKYYKDVYNYHIPENNQNDLKQYIYLSLNNLSLNINIVDFLVSKQNILTNKRYIEYYI